MPDVPQQVRRLPHAAAYTLLVIATLLAGCAETPTERASKKEQLLWPAWPDQPRFIFEAALRSEADIVAESEDQRLQRRLAGASRSDKQIIGKPTGIAARDGRIYVAEPSLKAVTVLDGARGKVYRFGLRAPNTLDKPQSIAVDDAGLVYVLDSGLRKVMVFDPLGLFEFSIDVNNGFTNPVAVAVARDGKTIYIVDRGDLANQDHKVVAFTPGGKERFRIGPRGEDHGRFNIPLAATVAGDGTLLVADSGNSRIQAFDPEGKFKFMFGGVGAEMGRFSRPRGIATDGEGNIYVSDGGFNNVQIFNAKGQLLMPLGRLSAQPGAGNYSLIASIAVDDSNRLFIIDHLFRKIEVFRRLSEEEGKRMLVQSPAATGAKE
jgi:DNA-binding beta-propeller fold protein YncE